MMVSRHSVVFDLTDAKTTMTAEIRERHPADLLFAFPSRGGTGYVLVPGMARLLDNRGP
jgi:hypothetical protein